MNTAVKLAWKNGAIPLHRIDQAISLNPAPPSVVREDLSRAIADRLNISLAFRYLEMFRYNSNRNQELIPRLLPVEKMGINFDLTIEALYLQYTTT
jgi:hypothetical protein